MKFRHDEASRSRHAGSAGGLLREDLSKGDEASRVGIRVSVGEFSDRESALKCYDYYWQHTEAYQSKGFGRIAAAWMMEAFYRLMPGCPVWLDIQTWSYKAIGIYLDLGFVPMKTAVYNEVPNAYEAALRVLKEKLQEDKLKRFRALAE